MSSGKLVVRNVFGLVHNSTNCISFSEDRNLVYSSGGFTVVINIESKEQSFIASYASQIPGHVSLGTTAIACCHSKKFIAVAEKAATGAIVVLYDSHSLRKKKVLACAEVGSTVIKCISFSECGRYCLTQGGSPEWNLLLWAIDSKNPKVLSVTKTALSDDTPVNQVSFCPWDSTHIVVIGKNLIKFFRLLEGALKPALQTVRKDHANFVSHCWIPDDILVLGTESGEIFLLENNEYRGAIYPTGADHEEMTPIYSIIGSTRGFVAGTVDGELRAFERRADKRDEWEIKYKHTLPGGRGRVQALVMGPDDYLVVATDTQQLFHVNISAVFHEVNKHDNNAPKSIFEHITSPFHSPNLLGDAAITAIDVALWRPIIATCGRDKTVRIWNVVDQKMESVHEFEEEPVSVAMHPSGLYIAVGFMEKVQIVALLLDGFSVCREVSVRACNLVKFAHGGHFFAVAAGSVVQIFHTHTGGLVATLRGHTNKIKSITWLDMDSRCITVGGEGAVFYWDLFPTPMRSTEKTHTAMVPFQTGAGPSDGSRAYLSTAEKVIRELSFSKLIDPATGFESPLKDPRDVQCDRLVGTMVFDETKRILLVGTADEDSPGTVMAMLTMPQLSSNMEHTILHSAPITAMCMSPDGSTLYTGDLNGCLVVSDFEGGKGPLGSPTKRGGDGLISFDFQDEVAIHKTTLDGKKRLIAELAARIEELTLNNEHQLRLKEMEHKEKMTDIAAKFGEMLGDEHNKYEDQISTRTDMVHAHTVFSNELDQKHAGELRAMESKYKLKQNAEDFRHKNLLAEVEDTHARWNEENVALVTSHQAYIKELCSDYEEQLDEENVLQQQYLREKEELHVVGVATQSHIELDGDMEIFEMNSKFETRLRQEDAIGKDLMAQHALIRKQLQLLVKDGDQQREEIKRLREREARLVDTMRSLERDIQLHKKEVREREETITDKEKRIFDLKKKNQVRHSALLLLCTCSPKKKQPPPPIPPNPLDPRNRNSRNSASCSTTRFANSSCKSPPGSKIRQLCAVRARRWPSSWSSTTSLARLWS